MVKSKNIEEKVNNKIELESNGPVVDSNAYQAYIEVLHEKV